jgi:hypothetical protein
VSAEERKREAAETPKLVAAVEKLTELLAEYCQLSEAELASVRAMFRDRRVGDHGVTVFEELVHMFMSVETANRFITEAHQAEGQALPGLGPCIVLCVGYASLSESAVEYGADEE